MLRDDFDQIEVKWPIAPGQAALLERCPRRGIWRGRVATWLFEETLPRWSSNGVDWDNGGFHEALSFEGIPLGKPKRMRTMARQVYAFSVAKLRGWDGPADEIVAHGIDFISRGRTRQGGWARIQNIDGSIVDECEDAYDHACVLLALAFAHKAGNRDALALGDQTMAFVDNHLEDKHLRGFLEDREGSPVRRTNPHMHLLEAFLAWHGATKDHSCLRRSARIIDLFRTHFFDVETWTVGEYFDDTWKPMPGHQGQWTEPGHHFEWASLLVEFARKSGQMDVIGYARKLYASAVANGINRSTGLAFGAVSRTGNPIDLVSRSWPQAESIKAAIALQGTGGPDMGPEIEARVGRLFDYHINMAPPGLWVDRIDVSGRAIAAEVPASIFYHLVTALMQYLDYTDCDDAILPLAHGGLLQSRHASKDFCRNMTPPGTYLPGAFAVRRTIEIRPQEGFSESCRRKPRGRHGELQDILNLRRAG